MRMIDPLMTYNFLLTYEKREELLRMNEEEKALLLEKILRSGPSEQSWRAILELVAAWPDSAFKYSTLQRLDRDLDKWPDSIRHINSAWTYLYDQDKISSLGKIVRSAAINRREQYGNEELVKIINSPGMASLKSLVIYKSEIYLEGLRELINTPNLVNLSTLRLDGLVLSEEKFNVLLSAGNLPSLRTLGLRNMGINTKRMQALVRSPLCKQVTDLDLTSNLVDKEAAGVLVDAPVWMSLKNLNLNSNYLGEEGAMTIVNASLRSGLKELDLGNNEIPKRVIEVIRQLVQGKSMKLVTE